MKITQREYSGEDDRCQMIQLARSLRADTLHVIDLPYRLSSWAMDDPDNISLWVDEQDGLVAWAVMQTPFWTIDYAYNPGMGGDLHPRILAWAHQRALETRGTKYGLPSWYVNVFSDQIELKQDLLQHGFVDQAGRGEDAWSKVWLQLNDQAVVPSYPLPAGFLMRPLAGEGEVEAYVELHRAVFGSKNMTTGWRLRTLSHPDYESSLDMVVVSPEGRLVAFCIGWLYWQSGDQAFGQIEPLGCQADYRKYALGRVVLCEAMRRLQQHGAKSIFVETDSYRNTAFRLYESRGFQVCREVLVYGKDYNDTIG